MVVKPNSVQIKYAYKPWIQHLYDHKIHSVLKAVQQ
jgi:hypothetical protein